MDTQSSPSENTNNQLLHVEVEDIDRLKRFVGFTDKDAAILKKLLPMMEANAERVVDQFYARIKEFPQLTQLIADSGSHVERLMGSQREYLLKLFAGDYGVDYFILRRKIGLIHNRIGLGPEWYLGGYSIYRQLLIPLIMRETRSKPKKLLKAIAALDKILALDAAQAINSYIDSLMEDLHSVNVSKDEIEDKVARYSEVIRAVAAGDLTQRVEVTGDDDLAHLGEGLNIMTGSLVQMTNEINEVNEAMMKSIKEVQDAIANQSSGASQQAAAVNETTSTLSEIRATSSQTSDKASELGETAERTKEAGERGLSMVEENISGMQLIREKPR